MGHSVKMESEPTQYSGHIWSTVPHTS